MVAFGFAFLPSNERFPWLLLGLAAYSGIHPDPRSSLHHAGSDSPERDAIVKEREEQT